ncbi:conserved exported hypothetical protein [uncultured Mycobacterium sp.]|uniref:PE-PGRS family protein n=1 Tax=uncultured Mycobacterium sp. TaxID=171292 RepID=A0A1Y5PAS2_9MYCO|nr:conserved exported hypothetical protein [uncultured Mycobacterium sp.]
MHIAVRSTVATGVALVGASAIALSPIQPVGSVALPLSEVNVPAAISNVAVELAAMPNPFDAWVNVITETVTNAGALGTAWLADPLPVGRQAAQNWIGYGDILSTALSGAASGLYSYLTTSLPQFLQTAFQQVAAGEPAAAASTINEALGSAIITVGLPFFPVMAIPGSITDNLSAAVKSLTGIQTLFGLLLAAIGPPTGVIQATGDSAQVIVDSLRTGDYGAAVQALFNLPPTLLGAVINGYTPPGGSIMPGLLTPPDDTGFNAGLVYTLLVSIPKAIATAITPVAAPAAARTAKPAASVEAAPATDATASTGTGKSARGALRSSPTSGKSSAKSAAAAKKPSGAKKSTGAKSARPNRGGSAAE